MIFSDTRLMNHFMQFKNVFFFFCYYVCRSNFFVFRPCWKNTEQWCVSGEKSFNKFHLNLWKIQSKLKENAVKSNLLTRICRLADSLYLLDVITFLKEPVQQYPALGYNCVREWLQTHLLKFTNKTDSY